MNRLAFVFAFATLSVDASVCSSLKTNAARAYPASAVSVHTADFDGDGFIDVLAGGFDGARILYGRGNGSLEAPIVLAEQTEGAIYVTDANGDGRADVIGSPDDTQFVTRVIIAEHRGGRSWDAARSVEIPRGRLAGAGDFTNDGRADLLITKVPTIAGTEIAILVSNNDGGYSAGSPANIRGYFNEPRVLDADGDGNLDFLLASNGILGLYRGIGTSAILSPHPIGAVNFASSRGSVAADFTGDGQVDLVITQSAARGVATLFDGPVRSAPGAGRSFELSANFALHAVAGDFNGDGANDLAFLTSRGSGARILLNDGRGNFRLHARLPVPVFEEGGIGAADLDRDGALDLIVGSPTLAVFRGNGDGTFRTSRILPMIGTVYGHTLVMQADFDGDGIDELVKNDLRDVRIGSLVNGTYVFTTVVTGVELHEYLSSEMTLGDLDGEPGPELVVKSDRRVVILKWRDGRWEKSGFLSPYTSSIAIADRRLVHASRDGKAFVVRDSTGVTRSMTPPVADAYAAKLKVADVDHDALEDLIVMKPGEEIYDPFVLAEMEHRNGEIVILRAREGGTFAEAERIFDGYGMRNIETGDFNDDGQQDIAVATYDGGVFLLVNEGGRFTPVKIDDQLWGQLAARDMNGDGITDLVLKAHGATLFEGSHAGLRRVGAWMASNWGRLVLARLSLDAPPAIITEGFFGELYATELECGPRRRSARH